MKRQHFQYHPVFGYHFIPGLRTRVEHESGGYLVRVNRCGFRSEHEFERAKPPDTFRVLLFGDSYTAGDGVSNRHRYSDVLEALVPGLQVLNFGLSGTGTDQHYLVYRELGRTLEHDLVVVGVFVQNIRRVAARFRPFVSVEDGVTRLQAKPYFTLEEGRLVLHNQPVPREPIAIDDLPEEQRRHVDRGGKLYSLRRAVRALGLRTVAQRISGYQPLPEFDRPDHPSWLLMRAILERWATESAAPLLVVPLPLHQHVEETASAEGYRARFAELAAASAISVHDPLPALRAASRAERRRYRFGHDEHWTPAGHRAIAQSLAPVITAWARSRRQEEEGNPA